MIADAKFFWFWVDAVNKPGVLITILTRKGACEVSLLLDTGYLSSWNWRQIGLAVDRWMEKENG